MKRNQIGQSRVAIWSLLVGVVLNVAGCHSLSRSTGIPLPWSDGNTVIESRYRTPARMVAIWSDATYNTAGKKPLRGFGGRLYFYNEKQQAIPVDGQLVVYAYDDSDSRGPAKGPARKYVFTAEQLTEHFSETDLGASYSVWLPWDEVGGEQKTISLVPILTANSGLKVTGSQSLALLPGTRPEAEETYFSRSEPESAGARPSLSKIQTAAFTGGANEVATANYQADDRAASEAQTMARMETTTIKPKGQLANQLLAQRNQLIVERYLQRSGNLTQPPASEYRVATAIEPNANHLQPTNFSRRPGDSHGSRVYTGANLYSRASQPVSAEVPDQPAGPPPGYSEPRALPALTSPGVPPGG